MRRDEKEIAAWLKDAHAMEINLENMLKGQIEEFNEFPGIQERIRLHAEETRRHATLVEEALDFIGQETSTLKEGIAKISSKIGSFGSGWTDDSPVKLVLSDFASEQFEIACYRSLICATGEAGLSEIQEICSQILEEERHMAAFLEENIDMVTRAHFEHLVVKE